MMVHSFWGIITRPQRWSEIQPGSWLMAFLSFLDLQSSEALQDRSRFLDQKGRSTRQKWWWMDWGYRPQMPELFRLVNDNVSTYSICTVKHALLRHVDRIETRHIDWWWPWNIWYPWTRVFSTTTNILLSTQSDCTIRVCSNNWAGPHRIGNSNAKASILCGYCSWDD